MDPGLVVLGLVVGTLVGTDLAYAAVSKSFGALVHGAQRTLDLRIAGRLAAGSLLAGRLADVLVRRLLAFVLLCAGARLAFASL